MKQINMQSSCPVPKQIEHWVKIGRIAEENPDLPYNFIKDILLSLEEEKTEKPVPYSGSSIKQ